VPAATPLPRGPSVLTLYDAADLLTAPGCPVCRYTAEASDRYLAWFALEGHADSAAITRLAASLGACPRHTRGMMSQPGAAARLTAVYRYLVEAAQAWLAGSRARLARCPACAHDDAAADRALDTLRDGLAEPAVQRRYRELGGLCLPHLRAVAARGNRRLARWLAGTMHGVLDGPDPACSVRLRHDAFSARLRHDEAGWLAGPVDPDAEARAALRDAIPAPAVIDSHVCLACLAAARAERDILQRLAAGGMHTGSSRMAGDRGDRLLCREHFSDALVQADRDERRMMLIAWQAGCCLADMGDRRWLSGGQGRRVLAGLARHRRPGRSPGDCPACRARADAAREALGRLRPVLRAAAGNRAAPLCVRHLLALREADPAAAQAGAATAARRAAELISSLKEDFRESWERRGEPVRRAPGTWRQAAVFLDGGVFGGCPPRPGS
jgi:hypothetical protein